VIRRPRARLPGLGQLAAEICVTVECRWSG
jgi:hypothetical protein